MMRDRKGTIIYVGKAISLRKRVTSYFRDSTLRKAPPKLRSMVNSIADIETVTVKGDAEALLTESNLIKTYRPRYNVLMRDDKQYASLRADPSEPFPRITTCRIIRNDQAIYFGPFPSDSVLRTVLDFTEKRFGLRKCNPIHPDADTYQHCINDIVRFCSAPCVNRISPDDYRARFDDACAFLRGERMGIIKELKEQMQVAAQGEDFEKAAILRDTWLALEEIMKRRRGIFTKAPDLRAADARKGIKELQELIGLPNVPKLIERSEEHTSELQSQR